MNKLLMEARKRFRGQKVSVASSYDNSSWAEGVTRCEIVESAIKEKERKGVKTVVHYMRVKCLDGVDSGKSAFPFSPDLTTVEGVASCAKNIMSILGDVVPGRKNNVGEFEVDVPAFMEACEDFINQCIGQIVEVRVQNRKANSEGTHLKEDGTPWQNFYINRGMGDDANGFRRGDTQTEHTSHNPDDDLNMDPSPSTPSGKSVTRKKVARKRK